MRFPYLLTSLWLQWEPSSAAKCVIEVTCGLLQLLFSGHCYTGDQGTENQDWPFCLQILVDPQCILYQTRWKGHCTLMGAYFNFKVLQIIVHVFKFEAQVLNELWLFY